MAYWECIAIGDTEGTHWVGYVIELLLSKFIDSNQALFVPEIDTKITRNSQFTDWHRFPVLLLRIPVGNLSFYSIFIRIHTRSFTGLAAFVGNFLMALPQVIGSPNDHFSIFVGGHHLVSFLEQRLNTHGVNFLVFEAHPHFQPAGIPLFAGRFDPNEAGIFQSEQESDVS